MKKHKELFEEPKRQHEEALQKYQEDHLDEMQIINLHKRCNKKVPQPKKTSKSSEFIDDQSKEEQKSKNTDGKKTAAKTGKKVKNTNHSQEKHQSHLNLLTQAGKKKKDHPRMIKRNKYFLYWG